MNLSSATELLLTYKNVEVYQDQDTLNMIVKTTSPRKFKVVVAYLFQEGFLEGDNIKIKSL